MNMIDSLLNEIDVPPMYLVRQHFDHQHLEHVEERLLEQMQAKHIAIHPGDRIAITCGSRGIANIVSAIRAAATFIRESGGEPFVVPAMGSHGGATVEGQLEVVQSLGVTEESVGCPICSCMDVVQLGTTADGLPVYIDRLASEADGIVLVNRVKPHTSFRGPYESGLMKMITIGLGKQKGAEACHSVGWKYMRGNVPAIANIVLDKANILFGIALMENAYDQTCRTEVLTGKEIPEEEPQLLLEAKTRMPSLPFDKIDVLVIDEIGKNISGAGQDPNITGRYDTPYASGGPVVQRMVILDLTEESHGNACGVGLADYIADRLYQKLDYDKMYLNVLTNKLPYTVNVPVVLKNDWQAVQAAVKTCIEIDHEHPRVVRIRNTLSLGEIYVSDNMLPELGKFDYIEVTDRKMPAPNSKGNLF
ncbi:MAG: lactate racemase domain-containing protein [Oscillospiraceae bacterium]|nr:lactate racemase domain-containing protein [Oscillospiraceae bacterium]